LVAKQHDRDAERDSNRDAERRPAALFTVTYETGEALQEAFARELFSGAVFVATLDAFALGQKALVVLALPFCAEHLEIEGEVVASLPAHIARAGAEPGVSIQLGIAPTELRRRIERASGVELPERNEAPAAFPRIEPRFDVHTSVTLVAQGRHFAAETGDISYNGMLVLLRGIDLGVETELSTQIEHPGTGEKLEVEGRIANQTRCDHGVMAVGVQFRYDLDRVDEVARFVDDLRSFHHARSLATVSGSLADTPLEAVLETFSSTSSAGTVRLTRGDDQGKIVYQDDEILLVTTGLVSGAKALGRLFTWTDAHFEFKPEIENLDDVREPLPLASAIVTAAVQRDELARLELGELDEDATFSVDSDLLAAVEPTLDDVGRELSENALMGFPLGAMLDMLSFSDARIYKALAELIESGILHQESR
jgi:Tfp pilus assembly protein PilZ